jgi:hypothetical protein
MNKNKVLNVLFILFFVSTIFSLETPAQEKKEKSLSFILFGTLAMVQEMGSNADYVPGENDFPITPSHLEYGGGLGLMFNFSKRLALQLTGEYLSGAEVDKVDPSDMESYTYRTYDNINALASLLIKFGKKIQYFVTAGGGMNILMPYEDKEETGSLGSIIQIEAPEKKINPMALFGGGVIFKMGKGFFKVDALYSMIFEYDKNSILIRVGYGF